MPSCVIDADSHVEEVRQTWDYLDERYQHRRPLVATTENISALVGHNAFWYIDGKVHPQCLGRGTTVFATPLDMVYAQRKSFSLASQGMTDPAMRLADMDKQGIDIQVIYPTVFLEPLTEDPAFEAALAQSYNTWIAHACAYKPERLKWAAVIPLQNVPAAVEEVRRAHKLGAACLVIHGTVGDRMLHESVFGPFFAEAERYGMPVCIHKGWSHPGLRQSIDSNYGAQVLSSSLPVMMGFFSMLGAVLDRHPQLKLAFLEVGVDWIPAMVQRMDHYYAVEKRKGWPVPKQNASYYLKACRIYFTCEAEEKLLSEALQWIGEDRVMIAVDMPHGEGRGAALEEIRNRKDLKDAVREKILGLNAKAFYSL